MSSNRNLYSKNIPVRMANSKPADQRFKLIHITVDYLISNIPSLKTELIIKLTDENDPFFLYSLYLNEEDYQSLKASQGLLVDFNAFGQRFIDLLQACEKDSESENPKFQLCFVSKEPLNAILEVVEINPFKHLCHLSLSFSPGNDNDVKKYLAGCLVKMREDYARLTSLHEETKTQLGLKLDTAQKSLAQKTAEMERIKVELEANTEKLAAKHIQELNFEKERSTQAQFAMQQKHEKEKRELEASLTKGMKQLEQRINELEAENKDLVEKRYKHETQIQELNYRNATLQEDLAAVKSELSQFKKENTSLDMKVHSGEKQVNQLTTRVAVLEQEIKDKQDLLIKTQETLMAEQCQRKQLDEMIKEKQAENKKKQIEINHYVEEFRKGSEALAKLQDERNKLSGQLKIKSKIVVEQEKKVDEKEREIGRLNGEINEIKRQLSGLKDENAQINESLKKKSTELDDANEKLKQNSNLINYYNKLLNENSVGTKNMYSEGASSSSSFRPYGNLLSTNNHFINSNLSPAPSGYVSTASKPPASTSPSGSGNLNMLGSELDLSGNPRLGFSQTTGYLAGKSPLLSSSSSSMQQQQIDQSKENLEINPMVLSSRTENLKLGSGSSTTSSSNGPGSTAKLDPKYFHNPQINLTGSGGFDLQKKQTPTVNHLGKTGLTTTTATNGANFGAAPKSKPAPPLASAYFPN